MASNFFTQFPLKDFTFFDKSSKIVDIFRNVDVNDILADDIINYEYIDVVDGERPDILSQRLYGRSDFYWTFFIVNDSLKSVLHDWPLSMNQFETYMAEKFDDKVVLIIKPTYTFTPYTAFDDYLIYDVPYVDNMFSGILTDYQSMHVTRNGATAKVVDWDVRTYSLTVNNISDRDAFTAAGNHRLTIDLDPGHIKDVVWREWLRKWCESRSDALVSKDEIESYLPLAAFERIEQSYTNEIELGIQLHNAFLDKTNGYFFKTSVNQLYPIASLEVERIFPVVRNAPKYFIDSDGNMIDAVEAFATEDFPRYVTNYEYEDEQNLSKGKIKIVRPEYIIDFITEYKRLISS